jgi:hypothetical protein
LRHAEEIKTRLGYLGWKELPDTVPRNFLMLTTKKCKILPVDAEVCSGRIVRRREGFCLREEAKHGIVCHINILFICEQLNITTDSVWERQPEEMCSGEIVWVYSTRAGHRMGVGVLQCKIIQAVRRVVFKYGWSSTLYPCLFLES